MEMDMLDSFLYGSDMEVGVEMVSGGGLVEKSAGWNTSATSSDRLQLAHFYRTDFSFSRLDRQLRTLEEATFDFQDVTGLDVPVEHEELLAQGPEGFDLLQGMPNCLADYYDYSPTEDLLWSQATDILAIPGQSLFDHSTVGKDCHTFTDEDDLFLEQLQLLLHTDKHSSPQPLTAGWQEAEQSEERACSVGSSSVYTPETSPPPIQLVQEVMVAPPVVARRQRRPYMRKRPVVSSSPSPSVSSRSSSVSKKTSTKVTPKKRVQNRQAAGDYRYRKRLIEEERMQEHEKLLKLRDQLREQNDSLMQELKFAIKMAEARLKRI